MQKETSWCACNSKITAPICAAYVDKTFSGGFIMKTKKLTITALLTALAMVIVAPLLKAFPNMFSHKLNNKDLSI